jgi:predicted RecB family nuclease
MQNTDGRLVFSATDLSHFLACAHLSLLNRRGALGGPRPPQFDDPGLEVLWQRGRDHEQRHLERLRAAGKRVVTIAELDRALPYMQRVRTRSEATLAALRSGADVVYQGTLFDGAWLGHADFLERVARPSALGAWSYEVVDTKLAREAKGGALLQVLLYADLLEQIQGVAPEHVHIELGGPEPRRVSFRVAEYAAYYRSVRRRFLDLMQADPPIAAAAEPVEHCRICAWGSTCREDRQRVDHLSLVAGISLRQRAALGDHGITTLAALGSLDAAALPRIDGITREALARVQDQARIQLAGRREQRNVHELLGPIEPNHGLAALPEPHEGDIFFDLEGDPFALTHGIEYLFGFSDRTDCYTGWWALDRQSERRVFEQFVDFVVQRRALHPGMHIYHYNHYETTALKRLMGRYATREREVDELLRGDVFVDLYRVVKQGLRASVESYSIKKLEPFYGFTRAVDLRSASNALAHFEAWLELGGGRDDELFQRIEGYNRDDCISTLRLHGWLERLRAELAHETGAAVPRREPPQDDREEESKQRDELIDALVARLTQDVPADGDARSPEQHARWLNAQLLEFHRREKKAFWWEYFHRAELGDDELIEDRATLGGLTFEGVVEQVKRSLVHRYRFLPQDHDIHVEDTPHDPHTKKGAGTVVAIDDEQCTIDLKRGATSNVPHPSALIPHDHIDERPLRESLFRLGTATAEHGLGAAHPHRCAADLLLRAVPRIGQPQGAELRMADESAVEAAVRLVERLDRTVLPIQGPPGAGKTYTAARMIVRAIQLGRRVGVTAQSHKVIGHLLNEICAAAAAAGVAIRGVQKADEEQWCGQTQVERIDDYGKLAARLAANDVQLVAGTAWLWSREDMVASVDILVIDEAGQYSLASALAVAPAAQSLVLVGDPQQLEQPIQGTHPPGVHVSALEHLVGEHTVERTRGLFLERTWRLHPTICYFTSELFYDGRLQPRPGLEHQTIVGTALAGSGLRFVAVEHSGNQSDSPEEAAAVADIVAELLGAHYVDAASVSRPITLDDILIVAPYNAQVAALKEAVPGARVGTVDKFQGQEAPIVIYSMTTSSSADAPRGMSFLYSPNRLNVATSRARALVIVVASPLLFTPEARSPEQMRLANAFCRFAELSGTMAAELIEVSVQ